MVCAIKSNSRQETSIIVGSTFPRLLIVVRLVRGFSWDFYNHLKSSGSQIIITRLDEILYAMDQSISFLRPLS